LDMEEDYIKGDFGHITRRVLRKDTYIGPCRCGFGPDAFYRDKSGRIIHASQVYHRGFPTTPTKEEFEAEVDQLRGEKAELEKRIKEIEEHLKTKERKLRK
jgi:hypothetical protein